MVMQVVEGMSSEENAMQKGLQNLYNFLEELKQSYARITQVALLCLEQIVTNDDLAKIMDTSDEWISSRTGIKQRHLSRPSQPVI